MSDRDNDTIENIKQFFANYGHLFVLLGIFVSAVFTRIQGYNRLRQNGEWIFTGNDAWYHFRATMYTVENYPKLIGYDALTGYPEGSLNGTFGTLFDLIHATVALILGLGSPSEDLVRTILIFSPPVTMGLIVILTYFTATFLTDSKIGGILSALFVTIFPGTLYQRSLVGFSEHHAMEALLMILTVFTILRVLKVSEDQYVSLEMIKNKESEPLKPWLKSLGVAIIAIGLYFFTWPPSVVLFAIMGVVAVIYTIIGYNEGRAVEPGLITLSTLSLSMLLMVLLRFPSLEFSLGVPSLLHVGVTGTTFVGISSVALLNRYAHSNKWSTSKLIGSMSGIGILVLTVSLIVIPEYVADIAALIVRVLGNPLGVGDLLGIGSDSVLTIAEEQPTSLRELVIGQYGLLLPIGLIGLSAMIYKSLKDASGDKPFAHTIFMSILSLFMLVIAVRTVRYNYYLAMFIAIACGFVIVYYLSYLKYIPIALVSYVDAPDGPENITISFIGRGLMAGVIGGIIVAALVLSLTMFTVVPLNPNAGTVYQESVGVGGYSSWEEPLEWLDNNSPDDTVDTYEDYNQSSFEYGEDDYGIMSWWDYGHWITVVGDRIPVANPFQQNAKLASEYLLSQNAEDAEESVESRGENVNAPKYVAIDWQMANPLSKHGAIVTFNEEFNRSDMYQPYYNQNAQGQVRLAFYQKQQPFYESMTTRLYYAHGSAMELGTYTANYTTENSQRTGPLRVLDDNNATDRRDTLSQARNASQSPEVISGGIGYTNPPEERVEALENYRLVTSSSSTYYRTLGGRILPGSFGSTPIYEYANVVRSMNNETRQSTRPTDLLGQNPSSVKIFERVDGARLQGTAESEAIYTVQVEMNDPSTNSTFTYKQRVETNSDGDFELTVPYSSSGYSEVEHPPEVRANSSYELVDSEENVIETFEVSETAVKGNETVRI
jgi:dolichyl-diphosphooligosaccharide--protein glycosyltransferase